MNCPKRFYSSKMKFVPSHSPCDKDAFQKIKDFIDSSKTLFVLTGAGISTESGIPDYRSAGVGLYATSNRRPVLYQDFVNHEHARRRYWVRNFVGWPVFSRFQPNITHKILANWEQKEKLSCITTQNVDRLHQRAGSKCVIELHGTAHEVMCENCKRMVSRSDFQKTLTELNPLLPDISIDIRPDGDVELMEELEEKFIVADCSHCGGIMKPFIVFFGDSVPSERVKHVRETLSRSDSLLALGTSLSVYSSYRFILQAYKQEIPICIVSIGETRGDKYSSCKVSARCGEVFTFFANQEDGNR